MLERIKSARLLWPTIMTIAGLAVLIALGNWQWSRKIWKEDLIAQINERTQTSPVPLDKARSLWSERNGDVEYLAVSAAGRFLHGKERYFYSPERGGPGWHVYTPLQVSDAEVLWINRGLVPDELKDPGRRAAGQVEGVVTVTGLVRRDSRPSAFTPANDPQRNIWYARDVPQLQASAFSGESVRALPFVVDADATPNPGGWPRGGVTRLQIPNRHLEYALTWWGLALTLAAVYAAFAWSRLARARLEPAT